MINTTRKILIQDLEICASVGIFDFEYEHPQLIRINIALTIPSNMTDKGAVHVPELAESNPQLRNVLCYAVLSQRISELVMGKHTELIETLANDILTLCLQDERVLAVELRVEKPQAVQQAASVGIEISANRML